MTAFPAKAETDMSLISQKQAASAREGSDRKRQKGVARTKAIARELGPYLKSALQAACEGYPGIELDELPDYLVEALTGMGFHFKPGKKSPDIKARLERAENDLERQLKSELKRLKDSVKRLNVLSLTVDIEDAPPRVRDFLVLLRSPSTDMLEWPNGALWNSLPSNEEVSAFTTRAQDRELERHKSKQHLESRMSRTQRPPNQTSPVHAHDWPLLQSWVKQGILSSPASWVLWKAHIGDDDGPRHSMEELRQIIRRDPEPLLAQLKISALGLAEEELIAQLESDLLVADKSYRVAKSQHVQWNRIERVVTSVRSARDEIARMQGTVRTLQKRLASAPPPANAVLSWARAPRSRGVADEVMNPGLMRWLSSEAGQATLKVISRAIQSEARRGGKSISLALKEGQSSWEITLNAKKVGDKSPLTPKSLKAVLRHHGYQVNDRVRAGEASLDVSF